MRNLALITAVLLAGSMMTLAQSSGSRTPPGGDMLGSDYHHGTGMEATQSEDAAQNQRMTGTYGDTKGVASQPAYAGSSTYNDSQVQSENGVTGVQGETAATAGRLLAENPRSSAYDTAAIPQANNSGVSSIVGTQAGKGNGQAANTKPPRKK